MTLATRHLSRLLDRALAGVEIIIMRSGKRLVRLMPVETAPSRRSIGSAKGDFVVPDDFNDPLPDEVLEAFGR